MPDTGRDVAIEIRLPFLSIRANSVRSLFARRGRRSAGPFLIVSVTTGFALDTRLHTAVDTQPFLWSPHGKPQQLWYLRPSGHKDEVHIVSAFNRLFLDGYRGSELGEHPLMRARSNDAWQRWRVQPAPDGRAHVLRNVGNYRALDCPHGAEREALPVMWEGHGGENQQWVLALPFSVQSET